MAQHEIGCLLRHFFDNFQDSSCMEALRLDLQFNNPWKPQVLKNEHANKTTQHQRCCCLIYVFLLKVNLVDITVAVKSLAQKKHLLNLLGAHKNFHHLRQYLGYHTLSGLVLQERMFLNKKKIICFLATKKTGVTVIDVMSCYTIVLLSVTLLLCYTSRMISTIRLYYHNYCYTTVGGNPAMSRTTYVDVRTCVGLEPSGEGFSPSTLWLNHPNKFLPVTWAIFLK